MKKIGYNYFTKIFYKANKDFHKGKIKKTKNIWSIQKKALILHPQKRKVGSVAQLNRASDYGSEGCGFESRRNHFQSEKTYSLAP